MNEKPDFFEWCNRYCENFGCSYATAMREYQRTFNEENYDPEDYEDYED